MRKLKGSYRVEEFWADRDITFSLERGDMLGIIGTNGAGKTTLLKAVAGIMSPSDGKVEHEGNISALLELASGFDLPDLFFGQFPVDDPSVHCAHPPMCPDRHVQRPQSEYHVFVGILRSYRAPNKSHTIQGIPHIWHHAQLPSKLYHSIWMKSSGTKI